MNSVCEKAKDRVDKIEERERYLMACYRHLICPKCGGDVEKIYMGGRAASLAVPYNNYLYECKDCDWKEERPI
jgi:hypothetical protein